MKLIYTLIFANYVDKVAKKKSHFFSKILSFVNSLLIFNLNSDNLL